MIDSIATYLPSTSLTNEDLEKLFPDWPAQKIFEKTGIRKRFIAAQDECASDLAVFAAEKVLKKAGRNSIDFLLFCTQSPDYVLPTTACLLQNRLGLKQSCGAIDFNLGCSGYIYGLGLAAGLIDGGLAKEVLLLNADTYSRYLGAEDKNTRTIFGDAAAATWLRKSSRQRLHSFVFGTDGSGADQLILRQGGCRLQQAGKPSSKGLYMNGHEIFSFTLKVVPNLVADILQKAGLSFEQIDHFVFHQANVFMLEHLRRKLNIPKNKFEIFLEECGNTVSTTIPMALEAAIIAGRIRPGSKVLLAGFGVGLSWGGCILEWNQSP